MPQILYLRLVQTPQQRRRVGARGGKATARNRRAHLSAVAPPLPPADRRPTGRNPGVTGGSEALFYRGDKKNEARRGEARPEPSRVPATCLIHMEISMTSTNLSPREGGPACWSL